MKKAALYILYLLIICLILLEVGVRVLTKKNAYGYEVFLGKPWRYMLPFEPEVDLDKANAGGYGVYDSLLGWDIGKSAADTPLYFSDPHGLRCPEVAFRTKNFDTSSDNFDIICIGDSYTHGDAVRFEETWSYLLQQKLNKKVLNCGVEGYGTDQATLKYLYSPYRSDIVILGLVSGDMERALNTVYNFYIGGTKSKPKFAFENNRHYLINSPAAVGNELAEHFIHYDTSAILQNVEGFDESVLKKQLLDFSYLYRLIKSIRHQKANKKAPVYLTDDTRLDFNIKIICYLQELCSQRQSRLVVLLLSNGNNFHDWENTEDPWALTRQKLRDNNIAFIDPGEELYAAYKSNPSKVIHPVEGVHYSPEGNEIVANYISKEIGKYLINPAADSINYAVN